MPKFGQKGPKMALKQGFLDFLKNLSSGFLGSNLKWKLILLIFLNQSHTWQNSGSRVMSQNAVSQSNCRILWNVISQEVNDEVYFWHADEYQSLLQVDTIILGVYPGMPKIPKIRSLHIFAISPEKHWGWSWFFCLNINKKVFFKLIECYWVCIARLAQSTWNNKFTMSLQYVKVNVKDGVNLFFL